MKYTLNALVLLSLLISFKVTGQISDHPPAQTIPAFQLFRLNSTAFTNKDLPKGKILFFMFVDPDCDHCQHAIESIGEQYSTFKKTSIYLISMDEPEKIINFMNLYGSKLKGQKNVTVLQDKLHKFMERFKPIRYPAMYLYSPENKLLDYEDNPEAVFRLVNTINKNVK